MPTTRAYYSGRIQLTCEYEVFDADSAPNRVLRAAASAVVGNPTGSPTVRAEARRLIQAMHEVGPLQPGDIRVPLDRRATHYRDAHLLARQILAAQLRTPQHGSGLAWGFLIRTPDLIETGIRNILSRQLDGRHTVTKAGMRIDGSTLRLQPDLVFDGGQAIADVKYKLHRGAWQRTDLYQVTTFATGYRSTLGAVVSFDSRSNGQAAPDLQIGDIRLRALRWQCPTGMTAIDAGAELADDCTAWLSQS
jgi:5-methylcytosine-specific restriction enzyme subunit McrC